MADALQIAHSVTGATVYALIRNAEGEVWNGSAFEAYATANLGTYDVPMTEQGTASRYYAADVPALDPGVYAVTAYVRAGGSPAETDPVIGSGEIEWDGTNILPLSTVSAGGGGLDAAGVRAAVGLASANLDTQLADLPTNAELATALAAADDPVLAAIAALNNLSSAGAQAAAAAALAAYGAATGTNISNTQTAILAKLPAALSGDGNLKADLQSIKGHGLTANPPFDV